MDATISKVIFIYKLTRIKNWFYILGIPLLAILYNIEQSGKLSVINIILFNTLYLLSGYLINNYFDIEEDCTEKNHFRLIPSKSALQITGTVLFLLMSSAYLLELFLETTILLIINILYSARPFRLKRYILTSIPINAIFFSFMYYNSAHIIHNKLSTQDIYFSIFIFLLFLPLQYIHYLEHQEVPAHKPISIAYRLYSIIFFFPVLFLSFANVSFFSEIKTELSLYSIVCAALVIIIQKMKSIRVYMRYLTILLGLYLLYHSL